MREDPMIESPSSLGAMPAIDNVVEMPNLMSGRLADLLAAAGGPAQLHELRGEQSARMAFESAVESWPRSRRHIRRTPALVAVTTVATMLVATTGLAAASVLPGPAGRAVDGLFGSVGVNLGPPATHPGPSSPIAASAPSAPSASVPTALSSSGVSHVGCTTGGAASGNSTTGQIETSSCLITAPRVGHGSAPAPSPAPATPKAAAIRSTPTKVAGTHHSGVSSSTPVSSTPTTTLPGGGTNRGGNIGGTTCPSTTTTTTPGGTDASAGSGGTTPSTDPTTTTTTATTVPGSCTHHGGHHNGGSGSGTTTTTTTAPGTVTP
jgi:hypothetical protein